MLKADRLCKTSCGWGGLAVRSDFCTVLKPGFGLWPTVTQEGAQHSEIKRSNTHEYDLAGCSALLFQYRQTRCKSARHGWEVETNFSVDDPAGKGVQRCRGANVQRCANVQMCKCTPTLTCNGKQHQQQKRETALYIAAWNCSPTINCCTARCLCHHCWNILSSQFSSCPTFTGGVTCWWEVII